MDKIALKIYEKATGCKICIGDMFYRRPFPLCKNKNPFAKLDEVKIVDIKNGYIQYQGRSLDYLSLDFISFIINYTRVG